MLSCIPYKYAKFPRGKHQCIRLLELQPGEFDDEIHIKITAPHRLKRLRKRWEALSYVWGSEENPATIHVGQETSDHRKCCALKVTRNLEEALRYLRHRTDSRTLWIDAICINEADKSEQSAHVAEMGEIYRHATQVIAWLGPAKDDSDQALDLLEYIGSQVEYDWDTQTLSPKENAQDSQIGNAYALWALSRIDERKIRATKNFWNRDWFYRVWILQEVILAKTAILQVGTRQLRWQTFRSAIGCINLKQEIGGPIEKGFDTVYKVCGWCDEWPYALGTLRWDIREAECRDSRDYIYGIMSLLHPSDRALNIQPNYLQSIVGIYQEIMLKWIARYQTLDLLIACELVGQDPVTMEGKRLPSWVPDWSTIPSIYSSPPCMTHRAVAFRPNAYTVDLTGQDSGDILRVTGVECATVSQVLKVGRDDRDQFLSSVRTAWQELWTTLAGKPPYLSEESLFDAFCRPLLYGRHAESYIPIDTYFSRFSPYRDLIRSIVNGSELRHDTSLLEKTHNLFDGGSLLVLSNGAIGKGLRSTQLGDLVCFLLGSPLPTVLRPVDTQPGKYYVVGPCYVDGMMAGEPLLGPLPDRFQFKILSNEGGRITLVEQPEGTSDPESGLIDRKDPRLERLGVDLSAYNCAIEEGQGIEATVDANCEDFRRIGVDLRDFDLI